MKKRIVASLLAWTLALGAVTLTGCAEAVNGQDLMAGITPGQAEPRAADETLAAALCGFGVRLLGETEGETGENRVVSPLSVYLALGMTAQGAAGDTLAEMEKVLGLSAADAGAYLLALRQSFPDSEEVTLTDANGIWFRDADWLSVQKDFLQRNADYFGAGAYRVPFDGQTVREINDFVREHTGGLIREIVRASDFTPDTALCLVNALYFRAVWAEPYSDRAVSEGVFHAASGDETATFLRSVEGTYLSDSGAAGFLRPYAGGRYSFLALLPEEGTSAYELAASLTPERYRALWASRTHAYDVTATMPAFEADFSCELGEALADMGMPLAFDRDRADFSAMASLPAGERLYISKVLHKVRVEVDREGTRAGAATAVVMERATGMPVQRETRTVCLDRPFVYAIVDTATGIPLFLGVQETVK